MDRSMTHQYKTDKQCFIVERATLKRGPWLDESIPQPGYPTKSAGSYPYQQRKSEYRVQSSYFYHTTRWGSLRLGILYKSSIHMQRYTARSWSEYSHSPEMYIRSCHVLGGDVLCGRLEFSKTSWRRHCHSFEFYLMVENKKKKEKQRNRVVLCGKNLDPDDTGSWRDSTGILLVQDLRNLQIGVQETGTRVTALTFPVTVFNPSQRDF